MKVTFTDQERRYFFKLLMLKASMEKDRKASRFWVDLAEQFSNNRMASNLKTVHLNLLLDIIKSVSQTINTELEKTDLDENRKVTLTNITVLLEAAKSKIDEKVKSSLNPEEK
jgi:biotin synthase-related radical SAM superfamily protein